jgi:hypothetical protein
MGKRGARGNSKQTDPSSLDAASFPDAPWLLQRDASGSEGSEPYSESETELSGSDSDGSSDRADAAPFSRSLVNALDGGGAGGDSDGVSSDDELDAAVVDVLQHTEPVVTTPQTDAGAANDAQCAPLSMSYCMGAEPHACWQCAVPPARGISRCRPHAGMTLRRRHPLPRATPLRMRGRTVTQVHCVHILLLLSSQIMLALVPASWRRSKH